jgi:prenyltransferase beta subunit
MGVQGGFTYDKNYESHAGLTYCALATLELIEWKLTKPQWDRALEFCIFNQMDEENGGFCGRSGKISDSCYSFWNKASIDILKLSA